jgi:protein-L-isoaspartate(D-aspartate) O-methyltransferase
MAPGSILVIPVEERPGKQALWRITRNVDGFSHENLLPVRFVPLVEGLPRERS